MSHFSSDNWLSASRPCKLAFLEEGRTIPAMEVYSWSTSSERPRSALKTTAWMPLGPFCNSGLCSSVARHTTRLAWPAPYAQDEVPVRIATPKVANSVLYRIRGLYDHSDF
jgi:hypothetical protein